MAGPPTLPDTPAAGAVVVSRRLLAGRYRLDSLLGGGSAQVWAARDELLRRPVAVQEVRLPAGLPAADREALRQRVVLEATTARRLHASGLVPILDVVSAADGTPAIVSELLAGGSLADAVGLRGPLPPAVVARLGYYLSIPLEAAHRVGLHHGLVTPAHVLLGKDRTVRLTGFGLGPLGEADPRALPPPERPAGGPRTAAADVWGLGATLFTAVEGGPPYGPAGADGTGGNGVAAAVGYGPRRPFLRAGPLTGLLSDLLSPRPDARPSLRDVREGLRPYLDTDGEPPGGRHARRGARLGRRRAR